MLIYYPKSDRSSAKIAFGVSILKKALQDKGLFCTEERSSFYTGDDSENCIVVSTRVIDKGVEQKAEDSEGFEIRRIGKTLHIIGADDTGAMYGLLDAAETVKYHGVQEIRDKAERPYLKMRGIKFNLPYQPYAVGDAFSKNEAVCMDVEFWKAFIDFLAMNRYNCLSLWSENPFEMMFRLDRFPGTTPYTDVEIARFKSVYRFIFGYAKKLGIKTYLITWNLRISPVIARGLGLPEELGGSTHDVRFITLRQHQEVVKLYFRESIKTLLMTYPDLTGLGTSNSEELTGTAEEREDWVVDTYLQAIQELDTYIPFIHRTNMSNGIIAKKKFLDKYKSEEKYISWKYSNAHMYSHPQPQFEELWRPWDGIDMTDVNVLYTVRNDDFHNLRGGDPEFVAKYVSGMKKPYIRGFYWGADAYLWASEFQHVPHKHVEWKYAFEKHWMQFETIGRLGYNPALDESIWILKNKERYGAHAGEWVYRGLKAGTRILCAVNRLYWHDYDYQWHPETLLSTLGFKTIRDFCDNRSMPGSGTVSIRDYVRETLAGKTVEGETPDAVILLIEEALAEIASCIENITAGVPVEDLNGELDCTFQDLKAWHALGGYYLCKFKAALALVRFESTGDRLLKTQAVEQLKTGLAYWKELSAIGSAHYLPYQMARVGKTFGWSYYVDEVEKDIRLAEAVVAKL